MNNCVEEMRSVAQCGLAFVCSNVENDWSLLGDQLPHYDKWVYAGNGLCPSYFES